MPRFSVMETNVYSIHAETQDEAIKLFMRANSTERDALYFSDTIERDIRQEEPWQGEEEDILTYSDY